jgi:uncharacterized phage protein gp47/JayE
MPWATPSLRDVRSLVRDSIRSKLPGADASIPNSVLRVLSDVQGALAHLVLQFVDWLALQLMPDTAETIWLDRHADIWLTNADGSTGRKMATLTSGTVTFDGIGGTIVPLATRIVGSNVEYETTEAVMLLADASTPASVRALDPGSIGNVEAGSTNLSLANAIEGVTGITVVELANGVDEENDDDLRTRVLERIRQPPMGGDATDYVAWVKAVPGVTRAWSGPLEMGMGTVTVRFMCDELRANNDGFPSGYDIEQVRTYLNTVRPVAVKDFFVVAPLRQRVDVFILDLSPDTPAIRAAIETSLIEMLKRKAKPGQTIFAAWKYQAIMEAAGVDSFDLRYSTDDVMQSPGHMAILGDIVYGITAT